MRRMADGFNDSNFGGEKAKEEMEKTKIVEKFVVHLALADFGTPNQDVRRRVRVLHWTATLPSPRQNSQKKGLAPCMYLRRNLRSRVNLPPSCTPSKPDDVHSSSCVRERKERISQSIPRTTRIVQG